MHKKIEQNNLEVYKAKKVYLARLHTTILNFILRNSSSSHFFQGVSALRTEKKVEMSYSLQSLFLQLCLKARGDIPFKMAKEIFLVK